MSHNLSQPKPNTLNCGTPNSDTKSVAFNYPQSGVLKTCQTLCLVTSLTLLMILGEGCTVVSPLTNWLASPMIDLNIVQVDGTGGEGSYRVTGNTTLPDQTEITISAVRTLEAIADDTPAYSILDRQIAVVTNGTWEARLNLWRVGQDGQFHEPWQINEALTKATFRPQSEVTFAAVLEPKEAAQFRRIVENQDTPELRRIEQYNDDGELYLRATKMRTLALPSDQAAPPDRLPQELYYQVPSTVRQVEVQPSEDVTQGIGPSGSRSDIPLSSDAYLR